MIAAALQAFLSSSVVGHGARVRQRSDGTVVDAFTLRRLVRVPQPVVAPVEQVACRVRLVRERPSA